jgi:hypothetical protein
MGEGRRTHHSCRVLSTCCVLCCLLVHHGCAAQAKEKNSNKDPVLSLFEKYGNGDALDFKGLEQLLKDLRITQHENGVKRSLKILHYSLKKFFVFSERSKSL